MTVPTLETPRLILRPLRLSDAPRIQQNFPHWEIVKYMAATIPWPYPADGAEDFLKNYALPAMEEGREYHWALTEKHDPESLHIGSISLSPLNETDNRGFWLSRDYQRRGYMTEAVVAVNDFAFDSLGMDRLILNNAEPNVASHRIKELSGAEIVEIIPDHPFIGGQTFSEVRWHLSRQNWQANRHKLIKPAPA